MTMKFSLDQLMAADAEGSKIPEVNALELKRSMRARMIARECIRNGFNIKQAYQTVTGFKGEKKVKDMVLGRIDEFVDEIKSLVDASQIDQQAALNFLWESIHSSILDYFDENGSVLPIRELKKLPRVQQALIEQIQVDSVQVPVIDPETKKAMLDDNGRPYLRMEQSVSIKLVPKMLGMDMLAKIMKWIGPMVVVNNNTTNIGLLMSEKATRIRQLDSAYGNAKLIEGQVIRTDAGAAQPTKPDH